MYSEDPNDQEVIAYSRDMPLLLLVGNLHSLMAIMVVLLRFVSVTPLLEITELNLILNEDVTGHNRKKNNPLKHKL